MSGIKSGYGNNTLPLWSVFNLYVIFICTSIPGLAISPIMGDLTRIFPGTSQFETQLLEIGPNIAAIPFVFLGGWIGTKFNNNKLTAWTCLFYGICGVLFFFVPNMISLIILSFLIGIFAGILSPLSTAFIADMFGGEKRTAQYGYTSATLNLVLMGCVIATGYLAKIDWRLPFFIYLLPFIPLIFSKRFAKYVTEPADIRANDAKKLNTTKVHYKFSKEVNIGMLVRYCIYYFVITFVIAAISLYIPFRYTDSATAGDLTSILFFGIMASGYTLNWCLKILKKTVAISAMVAIGAGFLLMSITNNVFIVGLGILIATYFYGIAQPYYYDRLSMASSRVALTLTLAWFASMDSIGNVVAAPVIDGIAKVLHSSTSANPLIAFKICTGLAIAGLIVVIIRKVIVSAHKDIEKHDSLAAATATAAANEQGPTATTAASINPVPADVPLKKVSDDQMVDIAANNAVSAAEAADKAAEAAGNAVKAADKAAQTAANDAAAAARAATNAADALDASLKPKDTGGNK